MTYELEAWTKTLIMKKKIVIGNPKKMFPKFSYRYTCNCVNKRKCINITKQTIKEHLFCDIYYHTLIRKPFVQITIKRCSISIHMIASIVVEKINLHHSRSKIFARGF